MKFRLTALIVILSLGLVSYSLAQDITPSPGNQYPTPTQTSAAVTPTAESTLTAEPATATIESTPIGTQPNAQPPDMTIMPGVPLGNVIGKMNNGSGGIIPDGQKVTLVGFDQDQSGNYQKTLEIELPVESDGSYIFSNVGVPLNRAFLVVTSLGGVEYQSDPVFVKNLTTNLSIPIMIYDKTSDFNALTSDQVHLEFDLSSPSVIQVTELYVVRNPGKQVVVIASDGTKIPFIQTPSGAGNLKIQLSQGSAQLLNASGGFGLLPGADKQYGFVVSFSMPYGRSLKFEQPFSLPVASLTVFVPQGMRLSGEQLTAAGMQNIQNQNYQMYQTNNMAPGSILTLSLTGKPGNSTAFKFDRKTIALISIGVVGILLAGVGIYLYLRDRARFAGETKAIDEQTEDDALGLDRDTIMDALLALDDQYKAGEIPKDAYEKRRKELKERLRGILSFQG